MTRNALQPLALLLVLLGTAGNLAVAADPQPRHPNIVFLLADDLGYGDLACYGHPYARTPNLDRLAREGTRFTQFYVTGVTCCPSRTGFMTSKFPATFATYPANGGFGNRVTISELLKRAGYATGHFGKWHIGPETKPGTYGIDVIEAGDDESPRRQRSERGRDASLYDAAIKFIEANKSRPFYVNVWGHSTHFPVDPPAAYAARFRDLVVDESRFGPAMHEKFAQVREIGGDVNTGMRNYLGDVSALDDEVGRLLAKLDELGLSDNTIVIFSSDHGPAPVKLASEKAKDQRGRRAEAITNMLGSPGPFRGGKHTMYEGGVRVPFIVRWPGHVPAGRLDEQSVISGIDWLPTLCAIAGVKIDAAEFDGEDVSAAWLGPSPHTRTKPLFWKTSAPGSPVGMRDGNWKMHYATRKRGEIELYDLATDPGETNNVAARHPEMVSKLSSKLQVWTASLPKEYIKAADKED